MNELMCLAKQNDFRAFSKLVQPYERALYRLALVFLEEEQCVFEFIRDFIISLANRIKKFKGKPSFYVWLYRELLHDIRNHKNHLACVHAHTEAGSVEHVKRSGLRDSDEISTHFSVKKHMRDAVFRLNRKLQDVLFLREIEELSYQEIAACLRLSVSTVEKYIRKARSSIRAYLMRHGCSFETEGTETKKCLNRDLFYDSSLDDKALSEFTLHYETCRHCHSELAELIRISDLVKMMTNSNAQTNVFFANVWSAVERKAVQQRL